jgi:hypothetical protein
MTKPLAEITKADVDRVDAVDEPATGIPFAIVKGLDDVKSAGEAGAGGLEVLQTAAEEPVEKADAPSGEVVFELEEAEPVEKSAEPAAEAPEAPAEEKVEKALTLDEAFELWKAARANGSPIDSNVISLLRQFVDMADVLRAGVEADVRQDLATQQALADAAAGAEDAADEGAEDDAEDAADGGADESAEEENDSEAAETSDDAADGGPSETEPNAEAAESPADTGDAADLEPEEPDDEDPLAKSQKAIADAAADAAAERIMKSVMSQLRAIVEVRDPLGKTSTADMEALEERVQKAVEAATEPLKKRIRELEEIPVDSGVLLAGTTPDPEASVNAGQGQGLASREDFMKSAMAETDPAKRTELAMALLGAQLHGQV